MQQAKTMAVSGIGGAKLRLEERPVLGDAGAFYRESSMPLIAAPRRMKMVFSKEEVVVEMTLGVSA